MTDNRGRALGDFAESSGRRFLMFREDPADHWAPGGVVGVAKHVVDEKIHDQPGIEVSE